MPYLEACFEGDNQSGTRRWKKALPIDREVSLGRIPMDHPDPATDQFNRAEWIIPEPTDTFVSGCHAILKWVSIEGRLHVKRRTRPKATANPIIFKNKPTDVFTVNPGEAFWIGRHKFSVFSDDLGTTDGLGPISESPPPLPPVIDTPPPPIQPTRPNMKPVAERPSLLPQPPAQPSIKSMPVAGPPSRKDLKDFGIEPVSMSGVGETHDSGVYVSMSPENIQDEKFANAHARLEALTRLVDLPRRGINVDELEKNLLQLLLDALPNASAAAIVELLPESNAQSPECGIRRALKRREGAVTKYPISKRLIYNVIRKKPECRLQLWFRGLEPSPNTPGFTMMASSGVDWTICCPLMSEYTSHLAIYVDGELPRGNMGKDALDTYEREELHDYQKFVEQASRVLTSVRVIRALDRRVRQLEQFVPPRVLVTMRQIDVATLFAPRALPVTVLFCDLRSSCQIAEGRVTAESLNELSSKVREALQIMTGAINTSRGVIGDLQGDAAMGFWGWPTDQIDQIDRAANASLHIRREFFKSVPFGRGVSGMKCGIGIAHGLALAGALGTSEHIKPDVFGPVVNLAARLEGMTKHLGAPILADEEVANYLQTSQLRDVASPRTRLMGRYLPAGMTVPVKVFELLPPEGMPGRNLSQNTLVRWEAAVNEFLDGDWVEARRFLEEFIAEDSGSADMSGSSLLSERPDHLKAAYLILDFMVEKCDMTLPMELAEWKESGAIELPK